MRTPIDWGADSIMRPLGPLARAIEAADTEDVIRLLVALGNQARPAATPEPEVSESRQCQNPNTSHGYASKRFPLTAAQGRVLYHAERIFRSAGGPGVLAAADWRERCAAYRLPALVSDWTRAQCIIGARLIELSARAQRMHLFRDTSAPLEGA